MKYIKYIVLLIIVAIIIATTTVSCSIKLPDRNNYEINYKGVIS
jgi:hypothetical protein